MAGKHAIPVGTELSTRLKQLMAKHGLSGAALAEKAGVKASFIYDILHGKSQHPSSVMLAKVAAVMGLDVADMVSHGHELAEAHALFPSPQPHSMAAVAALQPVNGHKRPAEEAHCYFNERWLGARLNAEPRQLRVFTVTGDCMEPSLHAGDTVLVDITKKQPSPPGIFALYDGYAPVIHRLEYRAEPQQHVRIISDNPRYAPQELPLGDVHIMGRVVWFSRLL